MASIAAAPCLNGAMKRWWPCNLKCRDAMMNVNNQNRPSHHVILSAAKDRRSRRTTRSANRSFAALRMTDMGLLVLLVKLHQRVHLPAQIPAIDFNAAVGQNATVGQKYRCW